MAMICFFMCIDLGRCSKCGERVDRSLLCLRDCRFPQVCQVRRARGRAAISCPTGLSSILYDQTNVMTPLTFQTLRLLCRRRIPFRRGDGARARRVARQRLERTARPRRRRPRNLQGEGPRLPPVATADLARARQRSSASWARAPAHFAIEVLDVAASTNTLLMERAAAGAAGGSVIAAEWQTHGRGRRGRVWHATPGAALTFSLLWRFQQGAGALSGLSLAVGVAVARTLARLGVERHRPQMAERRHLARLQAGRHADRNAGRSERAPARR